MDDIEIKQFNLNMCELPLYKGAQILTGMFLLIIWCY